MWESKFAAKDRQLLKEEEVVSETVRGLSALQQRCSSLETQLVSMLKGKATPRLKAIFHH